MRNATIRLHGTLRSLASRRWRGESCAWTPNGTSTIKHVIEAIGIPHTEVGEVRVDGSCATLDQILRDASTVDVFPWPGATASPDDLRPARFLADTHLGSLARELRLLGFDTLVGADQDDAELATLAAEQDRVLLTRDRELLKHRIVRAGCFVRSTRLDEQLAQLDERFGLRETMRPFSRCLECNGALQAVDRAQVADRLPESVAAGQREFTRCAGCARVYWRGSHWAKLDARVERVRARRGARTNAG